MAYNNANKLAVIGGGPIGLYTAIRLSRLGYKVDLFERDQLPKDKVCGQGIMPAGVRILEEAGIIFDEKKEAFSFQGVEYFSAQHYVKGNLHGKALGVERKVLSSKLYEKALSCSGLTIYENSLVSNIDMHDSYVDIKVKNGKDNTAVISRYKYIFACDGLHSKTREKLANANKRAGPLRMGARVHVNQKPWSDCVQVYWNDGVEAYVTPISESKIEVAFLWFTHKNFDKKNLLQDLLSRFPSLERKMEGSLLANDFRGYGPFAKVSNKMQVGRCFFIGDAYRFLDGITGEGVALGLSSAKIVCDRFYRFSFLDHMKIAIMYRKYKFFVDICLFLSKHTKIRNYLLDLINRRSPVFSYLLRLNDAN